MPGVQQLNNDVYKNSASCQPSLGRGGWMEGTNLMSQRLQQRVGDSPCLQLQETQQFVVGTTINGSRLKNQTPHSEILTKTGGKIFILWSFPQYQPQLPQKSVNRHFLFLKSSPFIVLIAAQMVPEAFLLPPEFCSSEMAPSLA